jgi:hypothetical protein
MLRHPLGGSGFRVARSFAALIPTPHSTHILPALVLLRKPLFGLAKRHIQPERYAQFWQKVSENIDKNKIS